VLKLHQNNPYNRQEQKKRDDKLISWIIADQQPFTVVEEEHFCSLIKLLDSHYDVLTRQATKDMIIAEYNTRRNKIINDIQQIPGKISLTADM